LDELKNFEEEEEIDISELVQNADVRFLFLFCKLSRANEADKAMKIEWLWTLLSEQTLNVQIGETTYKHTTI